MMGEITSEKPNSTCSHWSDCGVLGGGCCAIGNYGGKPSAGLCARCPDYDGPARGAGDVIADTIKRVTKSKVKPCGGCQKRRAALNKLLPKRK